MSLLLTLADAGIGGLAPIVDPSEIPDLTLEYKGGITTATPPGGIDLANGDTHWFTKNRVTGLELVTNGDFAAGTTDWISVRAALNAVSGEMQVVATDDYGYGRQDVATVPTRLYECTFDYWNTIGDVAQYQVYDVDNSLSIITPTDLPDTQTPTSKTITFFAPAGCNSARIIFISKLNGDITYFDNVTIKESAHLNHLNVMPTVTLNGIETANFDSATARYVELEQLIYTDSSKTYHPFGGRGVFTTVLIFKTPSAVGFNGTLVYNYNSVAEPDKWSYVRFVIDTDFRPYFGMLPEPNADPQVICKPLGTALGTDEYTMVVGSFDYTDTNKLTCHWKGLTVTNPASDYVNGASGFDLRQIKFAGANPTPNILDLLTYDRILTNTELNQLGVYYANRWNASLWTPLIEA